MSTVFLEIEIDTCRWILESPVDGPARTLGFSFAALLSPCSGRNSILELREFCNKDRRRRVPRDERAPGKLVTRSGRTGGWLVDPATADRRPRSGLDFQRAALGTLGLDVSLGSPATPIAGSLLVQSRFHSRLFNIHDSCVQQLHTRASLTLLEIESHSRGGC